MLQTDELLAQNTTLIGWPDEDGLLPRVKRSLLLSAHHSRQQMKPDGHWCGEVETNATTTAEYVFLYVRL
jgi:squalene-hopene/tetraprenyl-beta-curcumene cyclase